MYQVYIETPTSFEPEMVSEFKDYDKALELAETQKKENPEISYTIEETNGTVNSYGEQITTVVKRG